MPEEKKRRKLESRIVGNKIQFERADTDTEIEILSIM